MDKKNLKKSPTGVWLYRRRVPKALQQYYPSETICLSLETKSLTQARIKRDALNSEINLKADETKSSRPSKARFNTLFSELRSEYLKGARIERETGEENMFSYAYDPDQKAVRGDKTFEDAYYAAMNGNVPEQYKLTVSELFDEWLTANGTKKNEEYISGVKTAKKAHIALILCDFSKQRWYLWSFSLFIFLFSFTFFPAHLFKRDPEKNGFPLKQMRV